MFPDKIGEDRFGAYAKTISKAVQIYPFAEQAQPENHRVAHLVLLRLPLDLSGGGKR